MTQSLRQRIEAMLDCHRGRSVTVPQLIRFVAHDAPHARSQVWAHLHRLEDAGLVAIRLRPGRTASGRRHPRVAHVRAKGGAA